MSKQNKHNSLVHQLEDAVLALESAGESEQDIFSMVHMIMRGFIRAGELTPEYVQLANQVLAEQKSRSGLSPADLPVGIVDTRGNTLK